MVHRLSHFRPESIKTLLLIDSLFFDAFGDLYIGEL